MNCYHIYKVTFRRQIVVNLIDSNVSFQGSKSQNLGEASGIREKRAALEKNKQTVIGALQNF